MKARTHQVDDQQVSLLGVFHTLLLIGLRLKQVGLIQNVETMLAVGKRAL